MRGCRWGAEAASGSVLHPSRGFGNLDFTTYMLHFSPCALCLHGRPSVAFFVQSDLEAVAAYSGGVREVLLIDF